MNKQQAGNLNGWGLNRCEWGNQRLELPRSSDDGKLTAASAEYRCQSNETVKLLIEEQEKEADLSAKEENEGEEEDLNTAFWDEVQNKIWVKLKVASPDSLIQMRVNAHCTEEKNKALRRNFVGPEIIKEESLGLIFLNGLKKELWAGENLGTKMVKRLKASTWAALKLARSNSPIRMTELVYKKGGKNQDVFKIQLEPRRLWEPGGLGHGFGPQRSGYWVQYAGAQLNLIPKSTSVTSLTTPSLPRTTEESRHNSSDSDAANPCVVVAAQLRFFLQEISFPYKRMTEMEVQSKKERGNSWVSAKTQTECYYYLLDTTIKLNQLGLDWSTPNHSRILGNNVYRNITTKGMTKDSVLHGFAFVDCAALRFWVGSIKDDASSATLGALLLQDSLKEVIYDSRVLCKEAQKAIRKYPSVGYAAVQLTLAMPTNDLVDASEFKILIKLKGYFIGSCGPWNKALDCVMLYHLYDGDSRAEFESKLVERFGSLIKMPLLKDDKSPLLDGLKSILEKDINLYKLHVIRHGRLESTKGSYAKEWVTWEKQLRDTLDGNNDWLCPVQVPFEFTVKHVLGQLRLVAKGVHKTLSTEGRKFVAIVLAAVSLLITEIQSLLENLSAKDPNTKLFCKAKDKEHCLKKAHVTLPHMWSHNVLVVACYGPSLNQMVPIELSALLFSDEMATMEAQRDFVNGETIVPRNQWFNFQPSGSFQYVSLGSFLSNSSVPANSPVLSDYVRRLQVEGYSKPQFDVDIGDHCHNTLMQPAIEDSTLVMEPKEVIKVYRLLNRSIQVLLKWKGPPHFGNT